MIETVPAQRVRLYIQAAHRSIYPYMYQYYELSLISHRSTVLGLYLLCHRNLQRRLPPFWKKLKGKQPSADSNKGKVPVHLSAEPDFPTVPDEPVPSPDLAPSYEPDSEPKQLQVRLWNTAYEQLKSSNTELVESYEKILSTHFFFGQNGPSESASLENRIDKVYDERWKQMHIIVEAALERNKQSIERKQKFDSCLAAVSSTMSQAVRAVPEAAVAWTGICFALEMVSNSIQEGKANTKGIGYVVSRMNWYWHLAELLSDDNISKSAPNSLRLQMEKHIIDLYQKLLLYQMKSVCRYYRRHGPAIWRDAITADNWTGQLDDIRNAEATVQEDSRIINALEVQRRLGELDAASQVLRGEIQDVWSTIKKHILSKEEERCLKDLRVTDPRDDKSRIEDTNGGLLQGAYEWAIKHRDFIAWREEKANHMLWIKGDPGKGKTMLLCGIIDELQRQNIKPCYFFCQATDPRLNSATAVLRGLIYLLVDTNRQLLSHIQEKYDQAGAVLFQDANSWVVLSQIFTELLQDSSLEGQVFMIDALDECQNDLERLLDLIVGISISSHAKWLVSSRNWTGIEEKLSTISQNIRFSLELNEQSVSEAINHYIGHKTARLKEIKKLDQETELIIRDYLIDNARGTFLWVALVCKELLKISVRKRHVLKKMAEFPSDLGPLYERMMQQIRASEDSDLCERILRLASVLYRPITLTELASLLDVENKFDREDLEETVASCGSFLVVRGDLVRFVHQSAQDFLLKDNMFVSGLGSQHYTVFSRSLDILSATLRRDMYNLRYPGALIEEYTPNEKKDVLRHARYSCVYWVDHLKAVNDLERDKCMLSLRDNGIVHQFLKEKLLNWLEALSLMKKMRDAARVVRILKKLK
ncbi:NACHT domain-containing protein [Trichoderma velutinum]